MTAPVAIAEADSLVADLVRARSAGECEGCSLGEPGTTLWPRGGRLNRDSPANWLLLCASCAEYAGSVEEFAESRGWRAHRVPDSRHLMLLYRGRMVLLNHDGTLCEPQAGGARRDRTEI